MKSRLTGCQTRRADRITELSDSGSDVSLESSFPRVNVYHHLDSTNQVTATFELPGLKREDVTIDLLHDKLTVSGKRNNFEESEKGTYVIYELPCGEFSRTLTLPLGMRPQDFKARMENGLLTLTYPRRPPKQAPHQIPIE